MIEDAFSYAVSVVLNFWAIVGGIVLGIEPAARLFWSGYDSWAAKYVSSKIRDRARSWIALAAFVIANFMTYHHTQIELRKTNAPFSEGAASIVAGGTLQTTATPVSAGYNVIVSSTPGGGVILAPHGARPITVKNNTPLQVLVYPPSGSRIERFDTNSPVALFPGGGEDTFVCVSAFQCAG